MTINNPASYKAATPVFKARTQMIAKSLVLRHLQQLNGASLTIIDGQEQYQFGDSSGEVQALINVHSSAVYQAMMLNGSMGAAESYIRGNWTSPDLTAVIRVFAMNLGSVNQLESRKSWMKKLGDKSLNWVRKNTLGQAKKNIVAHYDLSNEFFGLFLDQSMMYSSAIYPSWDASLAEAQQYKLDHICQRLQLSEADHLLEIGTGWGALAIHAAKHYGCRVTTTTISDAQHQLAAERIKAEGLEDQINLLKEDYRLLEGQFDKLVSIEMIEAVGHQYYANYFEKCSSLVKPDGLMLIQAITIADQRFEESVRGIDFIRKYIFPGGCLPSVSVVADNIRDNTDMMIVAQEDMTEHYAKTLSDWRVAFFDRLDDVKAMGFSNEFIRMWDYYLCYCQGGFDERVIATSQFLFAKPRFKGLPSLKH